MKVTALAITPPPGARDCPRVTPELLASTLARYSRSNKGIESILAGINWDDPDKSVDQVFRFLDYGHASIGGLTGGIAMAIDRCSLLLALKLFEIAQLSDGQESSTRYIEMLPSNLPKAGDIGIPERLASEWEAVMAGAFGLYGEVYRELDRQARENPAIVRLPAGASPKVADRIRKNYALDRARYFIPFATETSVGLGRDHSAPRRDAAAGSGGMRPALACRVAEVRAASDAAQLQGRGIDPANTGGNRVLPRVDRGKRSRD
jgi:hypothetical protein